MTDPRLELLSSMGIAFKRTFAVCRKAFYSFNELGESTEGTQPGKHRVQGTQEVAWAIAVYCIILTITKFFYMYLTDSLVSLFFLFLVEKY